MKKFVFTLKPVLDLKNETEKQQKIHMKKIIERLSALFLELEEMHRLFRDTKEKQAREIKKGIKSENLQQYGTFFENLIKSMSMQRKKIRETEEEKEKLIKEQVKTRREIKTLEKLRERQYEEYLYEQKKEEEKSIGDFVSYKVSSKQEG